MTNDFGGETDEFVYKLHVYEMPTPIILTQLVCFKMIFSTKVCGNVHN